MAASNGGKAPGNLRGARFFLILSLLALVYLLCVSLVVLVTGGGTWKCGGLAIHMESMGAALSTFWYLILAGFITLLALNRSGGTKSPGREEYSLLPGDSLLVPAVRHLFPVLLLLFALAFALRIYRVELPPLEFHATRQYNNALIARHFFFSCHGTGLPWQKDFYRIEDFYLEPPLIELLSTGLYLVQGRENLAIPMVLSVLFWLGGALALYMGARKLAGNDGALFSLFFILFLPYAIKCSRCFMPDPLMTAFFSLYILMLALFIETPGRSMLLLAACAGSLAVFTKAGALFPVLAGAIGLLVFWKEGRARLLPLDYCLFLLLVVFPAWLYGFLAYGGSSLKGKLWGRFLPSLIGTSFTIEGWLGMIDSVLGLALLLLALLSLFLFRGAHRILICSLFAGYLLFLLFFNYHSATHDYYHMMLIPLAALMLGKGGAHACAVAGRFYTGPQVRRVVCAASVVILLAFTIAGVSRLTPGQAFSQVALFERVGEAVHHSRNAFILAPSYGLPLRYHGWVDGFSWPDSLDLRYWAWEGVPVKDPLIYFRMMAEKKRPDYFIILGPSEWAKQEQLSTYVETHYPQCWSEGAMKVYDMRGEGLTP